MSDTMIRISPELSIPLAELSFRVSRSGGPGGQHVNTSSTRVELVWDVANSPSLTPEQRILIQERLANRISDDGTFSLASSATRSQHRNREDAIDRFASLLAESLHVAKPRRKTRPSRAAREERLTTKKRRAETKKLRRPPSLD
jgi:ribosome-associated protein